MKTFHKSSVLFSRFYFQKFSQFSIKFRNRPPYFNASEFIPKFDLRLHQKKDFFHLTGSCSDGDVAFDDLATVVGTETTLERELVDAAVVPS
jgi:hypothetical protein